MDQIVVDRETYQHFYNNKLWLHRIKLGGWNFSLWINIGKEQTYSIKWRKESDRDSKTVNEQDRKPAR